MFADEDWKAVELFERVLVGDPDNPVARRWRDKALHKLAARETFAGEGSWCRTTSSRPSPTSTRR